MSGSGYPVVEERQLDRAKRWLLVMGKRDTGQLPPQRPGTVLVFEVGGRYEVLDERRHLSGREQTVVDAVAVSVIDVRERDVLVHLAVPSASPADDFTVKARFKCRVTQPDKVAAAGTTDLTAELRSQLCHDRELLRRCATHRIEDINAVRDWATARVTAFCRIQPPQVAGMSIALVDVEVLTPKDLKAHATGLRNEEWRQRVQYHRHAFENDDVDRLETIMKRGPAAVTALAVSRGEHGLGDAVEHAYRDQTERRHLLVEGVKTLNEGGHLDTMPIDGKQFVDALVEQTIGRAPEPNAVPAGHAERPSLSRDESPPLIEEDEING